ncbi:hypothetical protein C8J57DRAFT_1228307 [Mycena rebaudengoi]|nr:hypothetical protein C8J57DRAFT_1228307 [Mycena rebaudengoi]
MTARPKRSPWYVGVFDFTVRTTSHELYYNLSEDSFFEAFPGDVGTSDVTVRTTSHGRLYLRSTFRSTSANPFFEGDTLLGSVRLWFHEASWAISWFSRGLRDALVWRLFLGFIVVHPLALRPGARGSRSDHR